VVIPKDENGHLVMLNEVDVIFLSKLLNNGFGLPVEIAPNEGPRKKVYSIILLLMGAHEAPRISRSDKDWVVSKLWDRFGSLEEVRYFYVYGCSACFYSSVEGYREYL
jgi:hypothetical protein